MAFVADLSGIARDDACAPLRHSSDSWVEPFWAKGSLAANLYDISQILAWLARDRRDLEEQLQWREQISGLLKPLMN